MSESKYRHEHVESVPAGWRVRTVRQGKHRIRVAFAPKKRGRPDWQTPPGKLISVLHPAGENPCELRSTNPTELLVLGANPPRRRLNPDKYRVVVITRWADPNARPFERDFTTKQEAKDYARTVDLEKHHRPVIVKVREGSNPMPNPPAANTFDTAREKAAYAAGLDAGGRRLGSALGTLRRKRATRLERTMRSGLGRKNPAAETVYEEFAGHESEFIDTAHEPHIPSGNYARLGDPGELLSLYVKPRDGGFVRHIGAETFEADPPVIVTDETAKQIYFVGGNQDISESLAAFGALDRGNGIFELGEGRRIDYKAEKPQVDDSGTDEWQHHFGEENGRKPTVLFNAQLKRLLLEGGDYRIEGPWIRN